MKHKGFTLIELMVAISIIAILAAIGLAAYNQSRAAARDGKRISDIQEIQKALEQYYAIKGSYPGNTGNSDTYTNSPSFSSSALNPYFQNSVTPTDPINSGANVYTYLGCTNANKYYLCAKLENCASKCTNSVPIPTQDATCGITLGSPGPGNTYYCVSSLSN